MVEDHNIDPPRMYNLDETGVKPNRDTRNTPNYKLVLLRFGKSKYSQVGTASFKYVDGETIISTVCADGTLAVTLFVIKGKKIPH